MRVRMTTFVAMIAVAMFGCAESSNPGSAGADLEFTPSGVSGSCAGGVEFEARDVDGLMDITVNLNGLSLGAVIDPEVQLAEIDGFATRNGADTQLLESDRALLLACHRVLEREIGEDSRFVENFLVRTISLWSETPDTIELERSVFGDLGRAYTSICGNYLSWTAATHDGWGHDNWDADSTSFSYVGHRYSCTRSWINGSWTCSEPDHVSYVYQYGECYGNCGGGCPSGNQQLTVDCNNHDQCVRNGHALASFWCNDEFSFAADDELFAPSCSGT